MAVNDARKREMAHRIIRAFKDVDGKTIAILGLTFKPNTDDMREAPSLAIIPVLRAAGARIRAYDPEGGREASTMLDIDLCSDAYEAISGADGVVILCTKCYDNAAVFARLTAPAVPRKTGRHTLSIRT